jgi:hypothetical protein
MGRRIEGDRRRRGGDAGLVTPSAVVRERTGGITGLGAEETVRVMGNAGTRTCRHTLSQHPLGLGGESWSSQERVGVGSSEQGKAMTTRSTVSTTLIIVEARASC